MKLSAVLLSVALLLLAGCSSNTKNKRTANNTPATGDLDSMRFSKSHIDSNVFVNDTFFLQREVDRGRVLHALYIDPNKNSAQHDWVFNRDKQDTLNLKQYLKQLAASGHKLLHINTGKFTGDWRPVYSFRGKYYLYDTDDAGNKATMKITDSLFFRYWADGYIALAMKSITTLPDGSVLIKTQQYPKTDSYGPAEITIETVDKTTGLAIWRFNNWETMLMVPKQGAKNYQAIVNTSSETKYPEYNFEKIDLKKLSGKK